MITRQILQTAQHSLSQFRALCITGPRQSGKTTLSKVLAPKMPYVNFENPSVQFEVEQNPRKFLDRYSEGAVFDEVQRVPFIFRYLQVELDKSKARGRFILTGSNNFLLQEKVSQSLAGRAGYLELLPLSYAELRAEGLDKKDVKNHILKGGYPEIWDEKLTADTWLKSYLQTYVQRDVRLLRNIMNLGQFTRFIYLCANISGQILNRDNLAKQAGVDSKTVLAWLGLLENSYIIFLVQPWYNNLNKRIVKRPKLYFHDSGLLCHLLGISRVNHLRGHRNYGALFENWVVSEVVKNQYNAGGGKGVYYFRDHVGNEVDLVMEKHGEPLAIEIKSSKKLKPEMLKGLKYWQKNQPYGYSLLVFGGRTNDTIDERTGVVPWNEIGEL